MGRPEPVSPTELVDSTVALTSWGGPPAGAEERKGVGGTEPLGPTASVRVDAATGCTLGRECPRADPRPAATNEAPTAEIAAARAKRRAERGGDDRSSPLTTKTHPATETFAHKRLGQPRRASRGSTRA